MGNKYIGEWKNNKKNGQGTMTYFTASSYKGSWKDDAPSKYTRDVADPLRKKFWILYLALIWKNFRFAYLGNIKALIYNVFSTITKRIAC